QGRVSMRVRELLGFMAGRPTQRGGPPRAAPGDGHPPSRSSTHRPDREADGLDRLDLGERREVFADLPEGPGRPGALLQLTALHLENGIEPTTVEPPADLGLDGFPEAPELRATAPRLVRGQRLARRHDRERLQAGFSGQVVARRSVE